MKYLFIILLCLKIVTACDEVDPNPESSLNIKYLKVAAASCAPAKELYRCKQKIKKIESDSMMTNIRIAQAILVQTKSNLNQAKYLNAPYRIKFDSISIDIDSIKSKQLRLTGTSDQYYLYSFVALFCMLLIIGFSIFAPMPRK